MAVAGTEAIVVIMTLLGPHLLLCTWQYGIAR